MLIYNFCRLFKCSSSVGIVPASWLEDRDLLFSFENSGFRYKIIKK